MIGRLPVVVALGPVDPALVTGVFDGHCRFVSDPGEAELGVAAGAIVRAETRVDQAPLDKAPTPRTSPSGTQWPTRSPVRPSPGAYARYPAGATSSRPSVS